MANARPHTGRRRNDEARAAILDAAAELMAGGDLAAVTVDAVARRAGVGRQTIYRWWPSKGAVLSAAMSEGAAAAAPVPDTGSVRADLREFLGATFAAAGAAAPLLRAVAVEAQRDEHAAELLDGFVTGRREALRALIAREHPESTHDLVLDQVYGVLWYRLLLRRDGLDAASGRELADRVHDQLMR